MVMDEIDERRGGNGDTTSGIMDNGGDGGCSVGMEVEIMATVMVTLMRMVNTWFPQREVSKIS